MNSNRWLVPFLNVGHLLDHLVMLVFPTVVIALARQWDRSYSELLPLALGGFIAFGAFAIPAGWLADHWSRYKMMAAKARPRLPHRPFQPSAMPRFLGEETSIAMPTGW